jgi:hypothetical protein
MFRQILDTLLSFVCGLVAAIALSLFCPMGKTRKERLAYGYAATKRGEVRLLLVVQFALSVPFIIPFFGMVYLAWVITWVVVFFCPEVIYAYVDCGKAWVVTKTGEAKDWAMSHLPKKAAKITAEAAPQPSDDEVQRAAAAFADFEKAVEELKKFPNVTFKDIKPQA